MRDPARPLPFLSAARDVFDLTLEGMVWGRRSLLMALLLSLPILFGLLYRTVLVEKLPAQVAYGWIIVVYYIGKVLPLVALFYATSLIADEVEGRTLSYFLTRPVRRESILAGKFAAYLVTTLTLALPSTVVTFFLLLTARGLTGIGSAVPDLFRDMGVIALTLLAYGALFTLAGVLLRRPVIPGLLFILVWELVVVHLPGYMPRFTITSWLRSLVHHRPAQGGIGGLFGQVLPAGLSLAVLAAMIVTFLALALWIFSRREYVLEQ